MKSEMVIGKSTILGDQEIQVQIIGGCKLT